MENADLVKMMFQCFLSVYSDEIPVFLAFKVTKKRTKKPKDSRISPEKGTTSVR